MKLYFGDEWPFCACGGPVILRLFVHYAYPRAEYLPEAADPWRVQGGGYSMWTCGNPQCEPDALLAVREQIIDHFVLNPRSWMPCGLSAEQMAGLELYVGASSSDGVRILGGLDDDEEDAA
jgi:hypothetical protein